MTKNDVKAFIARHKGKLALSLFGLVTAILMLTIGFFRTLLIMLLTGIGLGYGFLFDRLGFEGANKAIAEFFGKLFKRQ